MHVTIYIRPSDKAKWQAIENKSKWISDKLNELDKEQLEDTIERIARETAIDVLQEHLRQYGQ